MSFFNSLFNSLSDSLPTLNAEESTEVVSSQSQEVEEKVIPTKVVVEEEEEEEEPEDTAPGIRDACASTKQCASFKHHFDECTERITGGKTSFAGENCVEELFHFMHCVDDCSAKKVFASLK